VKCVDKTLKEQKIGDRQKENTKNSASNRRIANKRSLAYTLSVPLFNATENEVLVHTYAFPKAFTSQKKQKVLSDAEKTFGDKYSKENVVLCAHTRSLGLTWNRPAVGLRGKKLNTSMKNRFKSSGRNVKGKDCMLYRQTAGTNQELLLQESSPITSIKKMQELKALELKKNNEELMNQIQCTNNEITKELRESEDVPIVKCY